MTSIFNLTFAVELLDVNVWHDCNEGWLDLDTIFSGMRIHYQLFSGFSADIDVLVWPHCAKIWYESQHGWVRTWQLLERRWIAFSISHKLQTKVNEVMAQVASVTFVPGVTGLGAVAKNDKNAEVYLPLNNFPKKRYFAPVVSPADKPNLPTFIKKLILEMIESFIPATMMDGVFDKPHPVTGVPHIPAIEKTNLDSLDTRHQEAVMYYVKDIILNRRPTTEVEVKPSDGKKKIDVQRFQMVMPGDVLLAGTGRVIPFLSQGVNSAIGDVVVLISTTNLPAPNDLSIFFVNIYGLSQLPVKELVKAGITNIYTLWKFGKEERKSKSIPIEVLSEITINDFHTVPVHCNVGFKWLGFFMEQPFEIQLRGIRNTEAAINLPELFGNAKSDSTFGTKIPAKISDDETDHLIAICPIDAQKISSGKNDLIKGEFSMYPPKVKVESQLRQAICTNDVNQVRANLTPKIYIQPYVILEAQMTLDVCIGFVVTNVRIGETAFSRFFCISKKELATVTLVDKIIAINHSLADRKRRQDLLTGFVCEVGPLSFIFVEGPKDRQLLLVWDLTASIYLDIKCYFSTSAKYSTRMYPELLDGSEPFLVYKTFAPLNAVLTCVPFYVRPTVPIPCRSATLKIARIIAGGLREPPFLDDMPTLTELRSFRMEMTLLEEPGSSKVQELILPKTDSADRGSKEQPPFWDK